MPKAFSLFKWLDLLRCLDLGGGFSLGKTGLEADFPRQNGFGGGFSLGKTGFKADLLRPNGIEVDFPRQNPLPAVLKSPFRMANVLCGFAHPKSAITDMERTLQDGQYFAAFDLI
jgi:hypothetical protein